LDGKPPGVGTNTEYVLVGLGHDPQSVLARAEADEVTQHIDSEVAEARRLGLFGSPHFVVEDEVFWGDDRLEEALAWAKNPTQEQPLEAARR
jgi:2-hydroxychromene-2-carboxylate isomerase